MLPYKTIIHLDRESRSPLYLQITNQFIKKISSGIIASGLKLPGSRKLSELLEVNRRTVSTAYEELEAQGWIDIKPNQGCFVSSKIPVTKPQAFSRISPSNRGIELGFDLHDKMDFLPHYQLPDLKGIKYVLDDGFPDVRLAPLKELARNIGSVLNGRSGAKLMTYSQDFNGDLSLRKELIKYLAETRSINISLDNLMLVRGSLMAFSTIFQVLLKPKDKVIMGNLSFNVANQIVKIAGGEVVRVPLDKDGIDVDAIEKICEKEAIRAVYILPHHHHPTTVSLSAERRMKLLMLAEKHRFAIIEDDYDYDFHYSSSPILPMASTDHVGVVTYVGTFSKTIAPGLRMGFIVAPAAFIRELSRLSRFMDCHGNTALERAISQLFRDGEVRRHLKKSLKIYHQRRDHFCQLLKTELGDFVNFDVPEGGLAVWVRFDKNLPLPEIRRQAKKKGLLMPAGKAYNLTPQNPNAIRMGFAALNEREQVEVIGILKEVVLAMVKR